MNTGKMSVAAGVVALVTVISGCAGLQTGNAEVGGVSGQVQSLTDQARRESAALRAEVRGANAVSKGIENLRLSKQAEARQASAVATGIEKVRLAKQAEARSSVSFAVMPAATEGIRLAKQAEARAEGKSLAQHQLDHGASSDRLR